MSDYSIRIPARGEEVEYVEGEERYLFEVSFSSVPYRLFAHQFWTNRLPTGPLQLPKEKIYIVERIATWMSSDGNPTVLVWKDEVLPSPLRSVDDLLAERLARRKVHE